MVGCLHTHPGSHISRLKLEGLPGGGDDTGSPKKCEESVEGISMRWALKVGVALEGGTGHRAGPEGSLAMLCGTGDPGRRSGGLAHGAVRGGNRGWVCTQ